MSDYKKDSKDIVDKMFETGVFHEKITRDDMAAFENLIEFLLQSKFESYRKIAAFNEKYK